MEGGRREKEDVFGFVSPLRPASGNVLRRKGGGNAGGGQGGKGKVAAAITQRVVVKEGNEIGKKKMAATAGIGPTKRKVVAEDEKEGEEGRGEGGVLGKGKPGVVSGKEKTKKKKKVWVVREWKDEKQGGGKDFDLFVDEQREMKRKKKEKHGRGTERGEEGGKKGASTVKTSLERLALGDEERESPDFD